MLDLVEQLLSRADRGEHAALALLVRARGSTPQKQGAAMVVFANGQTLGTLGGGCVEAEARARAIQLLSAGSSELLAFKLDHDYGWDDGLICGGMMDVAVQIFRPGDDLTELRALHANLSTRQSATYPVTIGEQSFELTYTPPARLILAGAGHVAMAVARMAVDCDFELTVIDDRADMANSDRFQAANLVVGPIEGELARAPVDAQTYVVIVTRGHKNDGRALAAVIRSPARYIGLIGSRRKIRTILGDLHAQGVPRELLSAVHAPVGLNIAAVTPTEIAVSIVAELIAVRRNAGETASMKMSGEELDRWLTR